MTREDVLNELTEIFRDVFDDDELIISDATTADDIEDWDSLENINILVSIQARFSIKFSMEEISLLKNVGEMVDAIISRI